MFRDLDRYQLEEFEPSWATQLDMVGDYTHSRQYLEREMNNKRSECKFMCLEGTTIDKPAGIQFSGTP